MKRKVRQDEERADWRTCAERGRNDFLRDGHRHSAIANAVGKLIDQAMEADEVELAAILAMVRSCQTQGLSPVLVRAVFNAFEQIHPRLNVPNEPSEN